jgi:glycine/D-amino acid oxidase-like deaminating enzyme
MSTTSHYDVIVIGAGLAGALVARYLADGGMQIVVLEATASPGGSAKSKHIVALLGTPEPYSELESRWGRESALHIWDLTFENLHLLNNCLGQQGREFQQTGSIRPTTRSDEIQLWQDSVHLLQDQAYDIELEGTSAYNYEALMCTYDDVIFDGKNLAKNLLDHPNIITEYGIEVNDIKPRKSGDLAIWGYRRYLWGDRVVLANGIHAIRFQDGLNSILKPAYIHTIDAHNVPSLKHPMIIERGSVNIIPSGDIWHITGWGNTEEDVLNNIIAIARNYCPEANVQIRNSGWVAQSHDAVPVIGALPNHPNVYTINGLGPFGASWVFVAARQLADYIMNNNQPRFLDISRVYAF